MKYKPFNLEDAKAGVPVCDKKGRPVRIVAYDCVGKYPIVGLIKAENENGEDIELPKTYTNEGKFYYTEDTDVDEDLVHPLNEKRFYINIYYDKDEDVFYSDGELYTAETFAKNNAEVEDYHETVPITVSW